MVAEVGAIMTAINIYVTSVHLTVFPYSDALEVLYHLVYSKVILSEPGPMLLVYLAALRT